MPVMHSRASHVAAAAALAAIVLLHRTPAAACPLAPGQKIVLASQELDPDVFVWDSRDHLVSYAQGDYSVGLVLKHTILVRAYTDATVLGCKNLSVPAGPAGETPPSFMVGVRVTAGSFRGRYGWVASTDVRRPDGTSLSSKRRP
jgi:hypothetical protein